MNIEVIIPVVNVDLAIELLNDIEKNTLLPKRIIIIDNSKQFFRYNSPKFITEFYYSSTGLVNESINLGISKLDRKCDYVSILNDDIRIGNWFFQRIGETFTYHPVCGVACGNTCFDIDKIRKGKVKYVPMERREGWAFVIRRSLLDKIPPIPHDVLTTFHGDDWIWCYTHKHGLYWFKDVGNTLYHAVGSSILKLGFRSIKRKEHNIWNKLEPTI
jgi:hypothetical protein